MLKLTLTVSLLARIAAMPLVTKSQVDAAAPPPPPSPPWTDCYKEEGTKLEDYQGNISTTMGGLECRSWKWAPYYQELGSESMPNPCRNPDKQSPIAGKGRGPWCYISNTAWTKYSIMGRRGEHWEFCNVPGPCSPPPPPSPPPAAPPPMPPQHCDKDCTQPFGFCTYRDEFTYKPTKWVYDENRISANKWNAECGETFWSQVAPSYNWKLLEYQKSAAQQNVVSCTGQMCLSASTNETQSQAMCSPKCEATSVYGGNGCMFHLDRYAPMLVKLSQLRASSILNTTGQVGTNTSRSAVSHLKDLQQSVSGFLHAIRGNPRPTCQAPLTADVTSATRTKNHQDAIHIPGEDASKCCDLCEKDDDCTAWVLNAKDDLCYLLSDFGRVDYTVEDRQIGCSSKRNCKIDTAPALPSDPKSGIALVQTQVSSLDTISASIARLPRAGFVPTFTRELYDDRLTDFMASIHNVMNKLDGAYERDMLLSHFAAQLEVEQAKLTGAKSVTAEAQKQAAMSIRTALAGLQVSSTGLKRTGELMHKSAAKLRDALEDWKRDQMKELLLNLASTVADVVKVAYGDFGSVWKALEKDVWVFRSAEGAWKAVKKAGELLNKLREAGSAVYDTLSAIGDMKDFDMELKDIVDDSYLLAQDLDLWARQPGTNSSGSVVQVLTNAMHQLNERLPSMGHGAWGEYVSSSSAAYEDFLTGYTGAVNAAAQEYITHLKAQATYGNDFTTQGVRYVAAVQQYLINAAQRKANQHAQAAMKDAYKVASERKAYDMMQESILGVQMTTLALQMQTTMQQLCESYRYQTTRLYDQCVRPNEDNVLNAVCGKFAEGMPAFEPFVTSPCSEASQLARQSQEYLHKWKGMYENANTVNKYISDAVWGKDSSAAEEPFVMATLEVYDPPPCDGSNGFWETTFSICNKTIDPTTNVTYIDGTECLADGASMPKDGMCCNITEFNRNCIFDPPSDRPYITRGAFERFADSSHEDWGKLAFTIEPRFVPELTKYDEVFVRGISAYLEGASIDRSEMRDNSLNIRLQPIGQMITRVKDPDWDKDEACMRAWEQDPTTLCMFNNHTFVGAPSGEQATVSYTMNYHNTREEQSDVCPDGTRPHPVFYNKNSRELVGEDGKPRFHYCHNSDLSSLEAGDPRAVYKKETTPYNFASAYSSYKLTVWNKFSSDKDVKIRSKGINLTEVKAIHLAMWVKTNGKNNQRLDECKDIERRGVLSLAAAGLGPSPIGAGTKDTP